MDVDYLKFIPLYYIIKCVQTKDKLCSGTKKKTKNMQTAGTESILLPFLKRLLLSHTPQWQMILFNAFTLELRENEIPCAGFWENDQIK